MRRIRIISFFLSIVLINSGCFHRGITVPTVTLVGEVVLKGDTSNPNYCTYYYPGNLRIDQQGNLWISDIGGMRLLKYNSGGKYQYQILFYPDSVVISKKSPRIDFSKMGCGRLPVTIQDFSFDHDGNLYAFLTIGNIPGNIKYKIIKIKRNGNIIAYNLDNLVFYTTIDSKNYIYASRLCVGPPFYSDSSLITVMDSLGNKLDIMCPPVIEPDWTPNEIAHLNRVYPAVDDNDNLWVAFLLQPIVRKYDSSHKLIWERKYLTTEIKQVLARTDSAKKRRIARMKRGEKKIPHPFFFTFRGIAPLSNGGALIFTNKEVVYELDKEGNICRKIYLKRGGIPGIRFYAVDDKSRDIYEYMLTRKPETKVLQIRVYKFLRKEVKGKGKAIETKKERRIR